MKKLILVMVGVLCTLTTYAQIGEIKSETYVAEFEKKKSIDDVSDYDGDMLPVALLNVGISDELYEMYPELRDGRVGLGLSLARTQREEFASIVANKGFAGLIQNLQEYINKN